jgi:flagellar biogenesis protein FliO
LESDLWGAFIRVIVCLPVVAILAYLFIKYGFSKNHSRRVGSLEIVEQISLLPKATINIVRVEDEYLLISATENEIVLIKQLDDYKTMQPAEFQFHLTDSIKRLSKGSNQNGQ